MRGYSNTAILRYSDTAIQLYSQTAIQRCRYSDTAIQRYSATARQLLYCDADTAIQGCIDTTILPCKLPKRTPNLLQPSWDVLSLGLEPVGDFWTTLGSSWDLLEGPWTLLEALRGSSEAPWRPLDKGKLLKNYGWNNVNNNLKIMILSHFGPLGASYMSSQHRFHPVQAIRGLGRPLKREKYRKNHGKNNVKIDGIINLKPI